MSTSIEWPTTSSMEKNLKISAKFEDTYLIINLLTSSNLAKIMQVC